MEIGDRRAEECVKAIFKMERTAFLCFIFCFSIYDLYSVLHESCFSLFKIANYIMYLVWTLLNVKDIQ